MAVITNINSNFRIGRIKHWIPKVSWLKIIFLPESISFIPNTYMRNMLFSVFPQIGSIRIDNSSCVIVCSNSFSFIDWKNNDYIPSSFSQLLKAFSRRAIRNFFRRIIPFDFVLNKNMVHKKFPANR